MENAPNSENRLHNHDPKQLPTLRFADGDALVKLSASPEDWLLVHRSVLQKMPYINTLLKPASHGMAWTEPEVVNDPVSGQERQMYTLSLKYVESTFILSEEKEVRLPQYLDPLIDIAQSNLCDGGWKWDHKYKAISYPPQVFEGTPEMEVEAHKVLFAAMYGFPISVEALKLCSESDNYEGRCKKMHAAIQKITVVGAYAEYYGGLHEVADALLDICLSWPSFWQAVADEPHHYAKLGQKLRHDKIYFDALRHMIAQADQAYKGSLKLAEVLDIGEEETVEWLAALDDELARTAEQLKTDLLTLQLSTSKSHHWGERRPVATTHANMLQFRNPNRSEGQKTNEKSQFLARAAYGQWLVQQLNGEEVWRWNSQRSAKAGSLASAVQKLERASKWDNPFHVFGKDIAKTFAADFYSNAQFNPRKQLEAALNDLVKAANDVIEAALKVRKDSVDGVVYRRTEIVGKYESLTYYPIDEENVPWKKEPTWEKPRPNAIVDIGPASEEMLKAVGIDDSRDTREEVEARVRKAYWDAQDAAELAGEIDSEDDDDQMEDDGPENDMHSEEDE